MQKLLIVVIAAGALIGLALPTGREPVPKAAVVTTGAPAETLLEREANGHFYVDAEVNEGLVRFVVDTGATDVVLTMRDAERLDIPFSRERFKVVGRGASGPVRGQLVTLDRVEIDGKEATDVPAAVVEGLDISLLGQSYLSQLSSVQMSGDTMSLR